MKARLVRTDRLSTETAGFNFELSNPFSFEAGQTCDVTLLAPRYQDEKGPSRTFSIASSPADLPRLLFATRLTGSAFKRTLLDEKPGLEVELAGPFGSFLLHKNQTRPAVFFAGGIGITPFHSIIKDATERHLPHRLLLLYSNRTPGSTTFLSDLEAFQTRNPNFRLNATVTEPLGGERWSHETGKIDATFLKPRVKGLMNPIYYAAGPPAFVTAMRAALDELGADPDSIRTEEFSGY